MELKQPRPRRRFSAYSLRKYFEAHSHLYMLFKLVKEQWKSTEMDIQLDRAEEFFVHTDSAMSQAGWELTFALLAEFQARVRASGAEFVLVAVPTKYQIDTKLWESYTALAGLEPDEYDRQAPQRHSEDWSTRYRNPLIDLFDEFRARNVDNTFYYTNDGHWNPDGHLLAAELILERLRELGLIGTGVSR